MYFPRQAASVLLKFLVTPILFSDFIIFIIFEWFFWNSNITSKVLSVLQSSPITISKSNDVSCSKKDLMALLMYFSWLYVMHNMLNNGVVSGMIAFLRTLLFQIGCIMLLPILLGLNGIWMGVVVAELLTLVVTVYFLRSRRKIYHY